MRIGFGYDVHRFEHGRKLFLGGIEIPYSRGLLGHSDADVLLHAICDAILGAAGLGDIGHHFPDTDKKYKNIFSVILLKEVISKITNAGFTVGNLDCTVVAEEPRIAPHIPKMRKIISETINLPESCVNIKATTSEGLGALGRKEGIVAYAVVLLALR